MEPILELLQRAYSLGLDSLFAGIAIGPVMLSNRDRALFAVLFGVSDGLATLLGVLGPRHFPEAPAAALYLLGVLLIVQGARHSRTWLIATPLLLGLDNLAVGGTVADVPVLAMSSTVMAAVGMALGTLGRWVAGRIIWATEAAL
jgi:putative Mn2+ efflux pump MntP